MTAGETYQQISQDLRQRNPSIQGLSAHSVRRFCVSRGIHYRSRINDQQLDVHVALRVQTVGHSYGRKTTQGLLRVSGIHASQRRVGHSLSRVAPGPQHSRRQLTHWRINPIPYTARFYGDKHHFDQNEKLVMYGVTHVVAVDGYSRKIIGMITDPVKNPISVYNTLMKPILEREGLWEQLRTDQGGEFVLSATVQHHLTHLKPRQARMPVIQSTSRMNHRVECLWPEVNSRINYPVKRILVDIEANQEITMHTDTEKFCVSWTTINEVW